MRATKKRMFLAVWANRRMPSVVPYCMPLISTNVIASRRRIAHCSMPVATQSRGPTVLQTAKQSTADGTHLTSCPRDRHASIFPQGGRVTRGREASFGGQRIPCFATYSSTSSPPKSWTSFTGNFLFRPRLMSGTTLARQGRRRIRLGVVLAPWQE